MREDLGKEDSSEEGASTDSPDRGQCFRKAEMKVARLGREKAEKAARFAAYERENRASFPNEVKRHLAMQEKLTEDYSEA